MKKLLITIFIVMILLVVPVNSIEIGKSKIEPVKKIQIKKFEIENSKSEVVTKDFRTNDLEFNRPQIEGPKVGLDPSVLPRFPELRIMDEAPEVIIISNKQSVETGEEFELTVTATDNTGVNKIYIYAPTKVYDFDCDGEKVCTKKLTLIENLAGLKTFRTEAKDIYGWEARDSVLVQINQSQQVDADLEIVSVNYENIDPSKYAGSSVHSFLHGDLVEATVVVRNNLGTAEDVEVELRNGDELIGMETVGSMNAETKVVKFQFTLDALACEPGNVIPSCHDTLDYARNYNLVAEVSTTTNEDGSDNVMEADEFTALSVKHHLTVDTVPKGANNQISFDNPEFDIVLKLESDQDLDVFKWIKMDVRAEKLMGRVPLSIDHSSVGCTDDVLCGNLGQEFNTFSCGSYSTNDLNNGGANDQGCFYPAVSKTIANLQTWTTDPVDLTGLTRYLVVITVGNHPDDQVQITKSYYNN